MSFAISVIVLVVESVESIVSSYGIFGIYFPSKFTTFDLVQAYSDRDILVLTANDLGTKIKPN